MGNRKHAKALISKSKSSRSQSSRTKKLKLINRLINFPALWILIPLSIATISPLAYGTNPIDQDAAFRQDLQALRDAGHLNTLTTTWPIPWPALQQSLTSLDDRKLPPYLNRAKNNLMRAVSKNVAPFIFSAGFYSSTEPTLLTPFGPHRGEDNSLNTALAFNQPHSQARLSIKAVDHATDTQQYQLDGSYLSANITVADTKWALGVGQYDRWWGPAWQSSLILSNNARPIPMIYLSRQTQNAFENRYLSWLGPWHLITFMGQLESHRTIPDALLWGLRITFAPHPYWEIGLSRTATWAGEGRPSGADTFIDVLLGKDNFEADDPNKVEEPGNQLGGIDIRFGRPVKQGSMATYLQVIGEDEAGNLPSRPVVLGGASITLPFNQAPMTIAMEYQDTSLDSYSDPIFNSAYNHGIYHTGYRYRGRSIGASTDNDTQRWSLGTLLQPADRWHLSVWFSKIKGNRDGSAGRNPVFQSALNTNHASATASYRTHNHLLSFSANWWQDVPSNLLGRDDSTSFLFSYQWARSKP